MFAWILILSSFVALLSLVLHDATAEDSAGSAISIAAKKLKTFTFWAILKATPSYWTSQTNGSKPAEKVVAPVNTFSSSPVNAISSSSEEIRPDGPSANPQIPEKQTPALPPEKQAPPLLPKKKWRKKDQRFSMTTTELESAISEALRNAASGCEDFVGVIVAHKTPKSHLGTNWAIQGVRYGKCDRKVVDDALTNIVERMQREFVLSDD